MKKTRKRKWSPKTKVTYPANCIEMPLLDRLCIAYTTDGGLENLVKKLNKRRQKKFGSKTITDNKSKTKNESDVEDDDIVDIWAEDDESTVVESVLRTRVKDSEDVDFQKPIPFQNYFFTAEMDKPQTGEKGSHSQDVSSPVKRKRKDLQDHIDKNNVTSVTKRKHINYFPGVAGKMLGKKKIEVGKDS